MNMKIFKEYDLGESLGQVRACEVSLGSKETGMLFVYSKNKNVDPCEGMLFFHKHPIEFAMFGQEGQMLWHKTLGMGVIPGIWLMPFAAFDLDGDGKDEIWFLNNTSELYPLNARSMILECLDPITGQTLGTWPFHAENTEWGRLGHAYRFFIFGGYAHGEPILVTVQGIYADIYMQAYSTGMQLRWEKTIPVGCGSRGSHTTPIYDFNGDGTDEVLFGEHMISLDDGKELLCFDGDRYSGHSDAVLPFTDTRTGKMYVFTARESGDYEGCPRVVTFDMDGNVVWEDIYSDEWGHYIDDGHMHYSWVINARPDYRKIAFAYRMRARKKTTETYVYDAITGEPAEFDFPYKLNELRPVDVNGDGYQEFLFLGNSGGMSLVSPDGKESHLIGGSLVSCGKFYEYAGEQIMTFYPEEGKVRIWGDVDAAESEVFRKRYSNGFLKNMMKMKGCGYNGSPSISCAF